MRWGLPAAAQPRRWPALIAILPVLAGLCGALLPAFGHFPVLGLHGFSLAPWGALLAWPGLAQSVLLSLLPGLLATALATVLSLLLVAAASGTRFLTLLQRLLAPLLALPHVAAAFAVAFLLAPSGLLVRAVSPWLSGWTRPPDWLLLNDPLGLAMTVGLVFKEVPFLLLMIIAALGQTDAQRQQRVAMTLGYGSVTAWCKAVLPQVYAQIRLPVYAVLAYSMTVVDMALILGPGTPPPLSVQVVRWMSDPDLSLRPQAFAAALLQCALVVAALLMWRGGEWLVANMGLRWIERGARGQRDALMRLPALGVAGVLGLMLVSGLLSLVLWSLAGFWRFPALLPESVSFVVWAQQSAAVFAAASTTAWIALGSTFSAVLLVLAVLASADQDAHPLVLERTLYLPLLVPQVAFLPGLTAALLALGVAAGPLAVMLVHVLFVLPYVWLSLRDPWRAWDRRYAQVGATLGAGPWRVLFALRLPMLLRPLLTAAAVGIAVSVGLYLPTLLVGGGRVATLSTEAVALAAGGDRRAIGVWALAQTAAALLPYAVALLLPSVYWRHRRGLHV